MFTIKALKTTLVAAAAIASAVAFAPTSASASGGGHGGGGFGGGFGGHGGHGPVVFPGRHRGGFQGDRGYGGYRFARTGYGWGRYRFRPIYAVGAPVCGPGFFLNYWGHCRPI